MATVETHVDAPPDRCFQILANPLTYSYWVVGARRIRAADAGWPAVGSAFDHTAGVAPLLSHDTTYVERMEENRLLALRAKARPFGTAKVRLELRPEDGGTRVTMHEVAADRITAKLFTPIADRLVAAQNVRALRRLRALAEGTEPIPEGEVPPRDSEAARRVAPIGGDDVGAAPRGIAPRLAAGFGRGFAAGLIGAAAMSVSTAVEIRLTGRPPSEVPAEAMRRIVGIRRLGSTAKARLTTAGHVAASAGIGGFHGMLSSVGLKTPYSGPVLFATAMIPDTVVVPALGAAAPPWHWTARDAAISVLHHGVFAASTQLVLSRLER